MDKNLMADLVKGLGGTVDMENNNEPRADFESL